MENLPVAGSPSSNVSPRFERTKVLIDWYVSPYQTFQVNDCRSKVMKLSTKTKSAEVLSSPTGRSDSGSDSSFYPDFSLEHSSFLNNDFSRLSTPYDQEPITPGKSVKVLGRWKLRKCEPVEEETPEVLLKPKDEAADILATALRLGQSSLKVLEKDMKRRVPLVVSPVSTPRRRRKDEECESQCSTKILTPTLLRPPSTQPINESTPKSTFVRKPLRPQQNIRISLEGDY
ncbi:unnamed protein product [Auanema sp. JU1783]|nr:unnamed protein product [Auanema sp. JU1783]